MIRPLFELTAPEDPEGALKSRCSVKNNVMVIAAHPDDEVLACGGAIALHVLSGDAVQVLILAEGITSRGQLRTRGEHDSELSDLERAARLANKSLGTTSLTLGTLPDNRMDTLDRLGIVRK